MLHRPVELAPSKREKSAWILAAFALMALEMWAISHDRNEQNAHFNQIAIGLTTTIQNNQPILKQAGQILQTTQQVEDVAQTNLKEEEEIFQTANGSFLQLTGGGQYCYLSAYPMEMIHSEQPQPKSYGQVEFVVANSGPIPLDKCTVEIRNNSNREWLNSTMGIMPSLVYKDVGPVPPKGRTIDTGIVLPRDTYFINILTRNNEFHEVLTMRSESEVKTDGRIETIEIRDSKGKVLANF